MRRFRRLLHIEVPCSSEAPRTVRRQLEASLAGKVPADRAGDLVLLTSELVTNAVVHGTNGEAPIRVDVASARGGRVRVAVFDRGRGLDRVARSNRDGVEHGWGLRLVERLAERWGFDHDGENRVWFELKVG